MCVYILCSFRPRAQKFERICGSKCSAFAFSNWHRHGFEKEIKCVCPGREIETPMTCYRGLPMSMLEPEFSKFDESLVKLHVFHSICSNATAFNFHPFLQSFQCLGRISGFAKK